MSDILFLDVINGELKVSNAVTIHQDAALDGRLHLCECQTELLTVGASGDVGGVNTLLIEIINNEITELIIGNLADETGLHAVVRNTDSDVCRRTADKFLKIVNLFQRLEILFHIIAVSGIEVDADSAEQDQIKFSGLIKINVIHFTPPMNFAFSRAFSRAFVVRSLCFYSSTQIFRVQAIFCIFFSFSVMHNLLYLFLCVFARDAMRYVYNWGNK